MKILRILSNPGFRVKFNEPMVYRLKKGNVLMRLFLGVIQLISAIPYRFKNIFHIETSERIVETAFIHQHLELEKDLRILEFGCSTSKLSIELSSLGYKVTGVDLTNYEFTHPNFTFRRGDFLDIDFKDNEFDAIVTVSSIEHAGMGFFSEKERDRGDFMVMDKMHQILKPGGKLLMTVPYGVRGQTKSYRVYDSKGLKRLLERFKILTEEYCVKKGEHWIRSDAKSAGQIDSTKGVKGVVLISATNTNR